MFKFEIEFRASVCDIRGPISKGCDIKGEVCREVLTADVERGFGEIRFVKIGIFATREQIFEDLKVTRRI